MFDALEMRRLLSVSLDDGTLSIGGTKGNDVIEVTVEGTNLSVKVNGGTAQTFAAADVEAIHVEGGKGNDRITVSDAVDEDVEFDVEGGQGNDTIVGGDGDDDLEGGPGNDSISGGAGDDHLEGGPGNDTLNGGAGDDHIEAGPGDDSINGGDGDDEAETGPGNDTVTNVEEVDEDDEDEGDDNGNGDDDDEDDDDDDDDNGNGDDDDEHDGELNRGQRKALEKLVNKQRADIFCRRVDRLVARGYDVPEEILEHCEDHNGGGDN